MESTKGWKTLRYGNTQQTGPAKAINAEAKKLKEAGIAYELVDYYPTRYTEELETRTDDSQ